MNQKEEEIQEEYFNSFIVMLCIVLGSIAFSFVWHIWEKMP